MSSPSGLLFASSSLQVPVQVPPPLLLLLLLVSVFPLFYLISWHLIYVLVYPVISGCSSSLFPGAVSGLRITHQPQSHVVSEGDTLFLECNAEANPPAQYEWYHNMAPMTQHKTRSLKVNVYRVCCDLKNIIIGGYSLTKFSIVDVVSSYIPFRSQA